MVGKYTKNKFCRPGERDYAKARAAQEEFAIFEKKAKAYQNLIQSCLPYQPMCGVYRNLRGDFLRIVQAGNAYRREEVPASQQELEFGHLWMPIFPLGLLSTVFDEASEYGNDEFRYVLVDRMNIGFNHIAMNAGMEIYQRKQIIIFMMPEGNNVWKVDSTNQFDSSREFFSVSPNGHIQEHPAWSLLPTPTLTPESAPSLAVVPQQQLVTAGEVIPTFRPDHDGTDVSAGCDKPITYPGEGGNTFLDDHNLTHTLNDDLNFSLGNIDFSLDDVDFSLGDDVAAPNLDEGADVSSGYDNSAGTLPYSLEQLLSHSNSDDAPTQTDNGPYPGYAPAKGWGFGTSSSGEGL